MLVLGIETSCDETSIAVVEDGKIVRSNAVFSSAEIHALYGGVFPELACRRHIEVLIPTLKKALDAAGITSQEIDLIAVAKGPGLIGALLIGLNAAKGLSIAWKRPFIGVHHVEAHLYAALMNTPEPWSFPALGLVLSGGHTLMLKVFDVGHYERIGTTVDDAIGEAFDKVASMLQLPYPGGPHIERLARTGNPGRFPFQAGRVRNERLNFSFSGLKTALLYAIRESQATDHNDLAASFQEAAFRDLIEKSRLARESFPYKAIVFGGGVCSNQQLRERFAEEFPDTPLYWPTPAFSVDNGAMIAGLGYQQFLRNPIGDPLDLEAMARIPFTK
jgi:N6-L-threonylcarbamoyladenine synthase